MTPGFNKFGFATGVTPDYYSSGSGSSSFSTRRGDSLFSSSDNHSKQYITRKGYDRGVDQERLYRPIAIGSSTSSGSGSSGGLYSNFGDKYGSRYGMTGSASGGVVDNERDYRPRPHAFEALSNSDNNNGKKDLTLSEMLDMSSTTGDNLDLQHKMQIHDLLYSNSSRLMMSLNEDARQLSGSFSFKI